MLTISRCLHPHYSHRCNHISDACRLSKQRGVPSSCRNNPCRHIEPCQHGISFPARIVYTIVSMRHSASMAMNRDCPAQTHWLLHRPCHQVDHNPATDVFKFWTEIYVPQLTLIPLVDMSLCNATTGSLNPTRSSKAGNSERGR